MNATLYQVNEKTIVVIETGVTYTYHPYKEHEFSDGGVSINHERITVESPAGGEDSGTFVGTGISKTEGVNTFWEYLKGRCVNGIPF